MVYCTRERFYGPITDMPARRARGAMTPLAPAPERPVGRFEPLITANMGFPALERLAMGARRDLWLAFRVFDPLTKTREQVEFGANWLELLQHRLRAGVAVRVLLADFDPIGAPQLHQATWRSASLLKDLETEGQIEILPVRHKARLGRGLRLGLWPAAAIELERQRREMNATGRDERAAVLAGRPGLWRYLKADEDGRIRWRMLRLPRLFPATLHQKMAVADGSVAMLGGLDIDERRFDDPLHQRAAHDTWHDISVVVDGPVATDIARHFGDVWNANRLRMAALRREQLPKAPRNAVPFPTPVGKVTLPDAPKTDGRHEGTIRFLRTLSDQGPRYGFQFSPVTRVHEIEDAHLEAIKTAKDSIYIETQYFRSKTIAKALARAGRECPDLNLVMVLPAAPDDIAFDKKSGISERYGEYLQAKCLGIVLDAFDKRAVILSPVRPVASKSSARDTLHGAQIVYVHSKIMAIDATRAIVGSANLNGRSLRWDTETALICHDAPSVQELRKAALCHWMIGETDPALLATKGMAGAWRALARRNMRCLPEDRESFVVLHDLDPAREMGRALPGVPEELV